VEVLSLPEAEKRAKEASDASSRDLEARRSAIATRRTIGWAAGGAGVGFIALGGVLGLVANGRIGQVEDGGLATSKDIESAESGAKDLATAGWIAGIAGIIAVGAGATLLLTAKSPDGPRLEGKSNGLRLVW
jgi:hypothetical protein